MQHKLSGEFIWPTTQHGILKRCKALCKVCIKACMIWTLQWNTHTVLAPHNAMSENLEQQFWDSEEPAMDAEFSKVDRRIGNKIGPRAKNVDVLKFLVDS